VPVPCSEESDVPAEEELRPNVRASDDVKVGAEKLRESVQVILMKKVITAAALSAPLGLPPVLAQEKKNMPMKGQMPEEIDQSLRAASTWSGAVGRRYSRPPRDP